MDISSGYKLFVFIFYNVFDRRMEGGFLLEVARWYDWMGYDMQEIDRKNFGKVGSSTKIIASRCLENRGLNIALNFSTQLVKL